VRLVRGFARFWWDFVVGDDGWIAVGVAAVLAAGALLVGLDALPEPVLAPLLAAAIAAVVIVRVLAAARYVSGARSTDREEWPGSPSGGSTETSNAENAPASPGTGTDTVTSPDSGTRNDPSDTRSRGEFSSHNS
jgi:hypothetical protein